MARQNVSSPSWTGPVDFLTLLLILIAGFELGSIGLFGFSLLTWVSDRWHIYMYDAIGFAAAWQLLRQRLFS